jgi:hypothetical protein
VILRQQSMLGCMTNSCDHACDIGVNNRSNSVTVSALKCSVIVMLVVGSVAGSLFSWGYASNEERLSFRTAFEGYASTLIEKFLVSMENRVAVASSLSVSFTSSFKNHPWPNVTMPDFQEHSQIPLRSASKNWIAFAPIVQADQRGGWEAYAGDVVKTKKLHTGHPNVGVDGYDNRDYQRSKANFS